MSNKQKPKRRPKRPTKRKAPQLNHLDAALRDAYAKQRIYRTLGLPASRSHPWMAPLTGYTSGREDW